MYTKTLYLIRHGQTDWNVQRKMQGHTNIPLNELGRSQARSIQHFFAENPVDIVFSSDLDRAFQTAEIATQSTYIRKFASLREVHLGEIEGSTETEILAKFGSEAWQKWISLDSHADYAFPGGETHKQSVSRILDSLHHFFTQYEFKKAAVCTHGLLIRRLGHHLRPDYTEILPIPNCGIFEVQWKNQKIHFRGLILEPSV